MSFLVRYFPASVFPLLKARREREGEREKRHQLQPVNFNPLPKRMLRIHGYSEQRIVVRRHLQLINFIKVTLERLQLDNLE
jgi:hypothetical protein